MVDKSINASLAVKGFIVHDNKMLILKRSMDSVQKPGIWELAGGRLNLGENPFEGLKREVQEEAGIDIEIVNPISVRYFTRKDDQKITLLIFLCKALTTEVILSHEHTDFDWIKISHAKEKISEFYWQELEVYKKLDMKKVL